MTKHNKITLGLLIVVSIATGLFTITAYAFADINTVREIQLMLYLKKYDLGQAGVDGKLGSKTQKAISDYMAKSPSLYAGHEDDLDYLRKTLKDDFRSGDAQPNPDKGNIEQDLNTLKNDLNKTKTALNTFIENNKNKQAEQAKNYTKDMGLVNTGSTFVMSILGVVLALMGIAGIAVYKLIKFKIEEEQKRLYNDRAIRIKASVYMALSKAFYLYYRSYFSQPNHETYVSYKTGVDLSLHFCDRTFDIAKNLTDKDEEKRLIRILNSNKSYHLATRQKQGDIDMALRNVDMIIGYAKELLESGDITGWADIQETLAWIYIRSGQPAKVTLGKSIISDLLNNDYLDQKFKDEISQNYANVGIVI